MRIRRIASVVALAVAFSVGLTATRAEPSGFRLESRLPASTLAFASVEGLGRLEERWNSTAIGKFMAEPEVKAFLAPIREQVEALLKGGGGGGRRGRGPLGDVPPILLEALQQLKGLDGQIAIALVDIDLERGMPRLAASLDFGGNVNGFVQFLAKLQKEIDPEGRHLKTTQIDGRPAWTVDADGLPIVATIVDTAFVVATGEDLLREILSGATQGSLAASEEFVAVQRRTAGDQPLAFVFANVEAGLARFGSKIPQEARAIVNALGLDTVKSAAYGLSFSGDGFADSVSIHTHDADRGIVALLQMEPLGDGRFLSMVPANAFLYEESTYDLSTYLPRLRPILAAIDPGMSREVERGIADASRALGVDIEKQVLSTLGAGTAIYAALPETGGLFPELAVMVRSKDPAATEKAFESLTAGIAGMINEHGQMIAGVRTLDYHGKRLHLFDIQKAKGDDPIPFTPTWMLSGDALVITLVPHTMKEIVLRGEEGMRGGLSNQEDFQALWKLKPADAGAAGYVDLQAGLALLYDTLVPLLQTIAKPNVTKDLPIRFDWAQLPAARTVRKHFRSIAFFESANENGISFSLHAPVPLVPVITAVAVAAGVAFMARGHSKAEAIAERDGVARAQAVPRAGGGGATATEVTARQVEQAVQMYYLVNRKLPASLSDLVKPDTESGEKYLDTMPVDGWGNSFEYRVTGESTFEITSGGPDGMVGTADDLRWPKSKGG